MASSPSIMYGPEETRNIPYPSALLGSELRSCPVATPNRAEGSFGDGGIGAVVASAMSYGSVASGRTSWIRSVSGSGTSRPDIEFAFPSRYAEKPSMLAR